MMLAIDDYGSGYSNDVRVLSMNPDIVKIDIKMIKGISEDIDKQKLVGNFVSFCHSKNIKLVAEGVEDKKDLEKVIELDVDFVQGFYTGVPSFEFGGISDAVKSEIVEMNGL